MPSDFFPSMVEDPYLFGQIAAANSLSDVWAMGGRPIMALNIAAFPEDMNTETLEKVLKGGAEKVIEAGIPVGLISNGKDIYTHERIVRESGSGVKHMRVLDTALARIDAKAENYNFADVLKDEMISNTDGLSSRTYYIIISNNRSKELIENYRETKKLGILSYFIIPEYTQYEITEQIPDMIKWDID